MKKNTPRYSRLVAARKSAANKRYRRGKMIFKLGDVVIVMHKDEPTGAEGIIDGIDNSDVNTYDVEITKSGPVPQSGHWPEYATKWEHWNIWPIHLKKKIELTPEADSVFRGILRDV